PARPPSRASFPTRRSSDLPRGRLAAVTKEIATLKAEWLAQWMPRLTAKTTPLSPYRVLWDLMHTVDVANTIITHDAGSPRDQISDRKSTRLNSSHQIISYA